jgi:tRNA(Leu) C34 or U34 (ribose-2'-O)-methylase TrmL
VLGGEHLPSFFNSSFSLLPFFFSLSLSLYRANPSNVWACLRTIDAFGIQYVDIVVDSEQYTGKSGLSQKRGMRVAMGSAQWLSLRNHISTSEAIATLRQENYRIFAADLNPTAKDIRTIDWLGAAATDAADKDDDDNDADNDDDNDHPCIVQPICIVMGNEENGISTEMRAAADECFTLPMVGFAESFNLSVATAITLAHMSAASSSSNSSSLSTNTCNHHVETKNRRGGGPLRPGNLSPHEYNCLFLKGLVNSISNRRMVYAVLRQEGIELPIQRL